MSFFGEDENNKHAPRAFTEAEKGSGKSIFIPAIANFSAQYNLQAIAIALVLMDPLYPNSDSGHAWVKSVADSVVFAGAILGQLCLGAAGDILGRDNAMLLTLAFTAFGALGSGVASWGDDTTVYIIVCTSRFVLGMGVGGVYPLSATKALEESQEGEDGAQRVSWAFFWQTPGVMGPYAVALLMYVLTDDPSLRFRVVLGLGAVPAFIVWSNELLSRWQEGAKPPPVNPVSSSELWKSLWEREHWVKLVGTGGTWFLWDFLYYGTTLSSPLIMKATFGDSDTVLPDCWQNIVAAAMGIPGVLAAIYVGPMVGMRWLQIYGFWLLGGVYIVMGLLFQLVPDSHTLLFVAYCALQFALNWGPNLSTFVLPSETYPAEVRCTFNGASACMGKAGALIGSAIFKPINDAWGIHIVFYICTGVCLVSIWATHTFVHETRPEFQDGAGEGGGKERLMHPQGLEDLDRIRNPAM